MIPRGAALQARHKREQGRSELGGDERQEVGGHMEGQMIELGGGFALVRNFFLPVTETKFRPAAKKEPLSLCTRNIHGRGISVMAGSSNSNNIVLFLTQILFSLSLS